MTRSKVYSIWIDTCLREQIDYPVAFQITDHRRVSSQPKMEVGERREKNLLHILDELLLHPPSLKEKVG